MQLCHDYKIFILMSCWDVENAVQHCLKEEEYQENLETCDFLTTINVCNLLHYSWHQNVAANHKKDV